THEVERLKARRLDRFLHVHSELDDVQQHLDERLILVIAAGRREHHERFAVLEHKSWSEGDPRALARLKNVRMTFFQKERLHTLAEQDASVTGYDCRKPRTRRSRAEQITVLVDDVDAGGVVCALGFGHFRL